MWLLQLAPLLDHALADALDETGAQTDRQAWVCLIVFVGFQKWGLCIFGFRPPGYYISVSAFLLY